VISSEEMMFFLYTYWCY